jgi:hypothetical protein
MSFRQNNETTRKWNAFYQANRELIEQTGVPRPIVETWDLFTDLLMHGYIDHHDDPTHFTIKELTPDQLELLRQLVDKYFEAGFPSPGLDTLVTGGTEGWVALVKKYPGQFGPRSVTYAHEWDETHSDQQ